MLNAHVADTLRRELQGRPAVQIWGREGMVSSAVPEASYSAANVLRSGGNAIDAAVALASSLAVTTHHWAGMAGDTIWLIHCAKDNSSYQIDGYSTCPAEMTADFLRDHFDLDDVRDAAAFREEPNNYRNCGAAISMTPGSPAAWYEAWRRFGSKPFSELIADAIHQAEDGIIVNRYLAGWLKSSEEKLRQFPSSKQIFFRDSGNADTVYGEGETLVQRDLGKTLRLYSEEPETAFYQGAIARAIVDHIQRAGGISTLSDLSNYRAVWRTPVAGTFRNCPIVVTAPPSAGIHVLQVLKTLEAHSSFHNAPYHSAESLHIMIQACRIALADRRNLVGDPDHSNFDFNHLIGKDHSLESARRIQDSKATSVGHGGRSLADQTTHYVVIDKWENVVSGTQSIGMNFGCGEVAEGTGLCLNDRSWAMSLCDGPNQVRPNYRPNIGHAPTLVMAEGRPWIALGSPGGLGIVQYVVQTIVNVIDHGMDIQDAVEAPRFRVQDLEFSVGIESRIERSVCEQLLAYGHDVVLWPEWTNNVGGVSAFQIGKHNRNILGGYDPRRNSLAVGL